MKRTLIHWCGLLGVVSLISYVAALLFSPLAYAGYDWMAQAVSDLSAVDAPVQRSVDTACFALRRLSHSFHLGIYLFAVMNWISYVDYESFPLTQ